MSDFTPTIQQVRDGYRYDLEDEYRDPIGAPQRSAEAGRAFDRWLAAHDTELREQIAAEIETASTDDVAWEVSVEAFDAGMRYAARVARGEKP